MTKLAAEVLHCPPQDVHVISGDTDHALFDKGAYASSGTCFRVTRRVWQRKIYGRKFCSTARKCWVSQWQMFNWQRRASCAARKAKLVSGILPIKAKPAPALVLVGTGSYITPDFAFPYGANFAEVAVNTRTGEIRLDKFYALLDCGTPVNPELALGQIYGATLRAMATV